MVKVSADFVQSVNSVKAQLLAREQHKKRLVSRGPLERASHSCARPAFLVARARVCMPTSAGALNRPSVAQLDPRKSAFLGFWDAVTGAALIYTAIITPFEVGFLEAPTSASDGWFLINRLIDAVFIFDMGLQFFVMYQIRDPNVRVIAWQDNHQKIIWNYFSGWFVVDVMSIAPSGFDFVSLGQRQADDTTSKLKALRLIRILRLFKLIRLLRTSRIFRRWKAQLSLSYGQTVVIKCIILLVLVAHWFACALELHTSFLDSPVESWLGVYGYCNPVVRAPGWTSDQCSGDSSLGCGEHWECSAVGTLYLAAFSWSMLVLTGTGGTDAYPYANSNTETAFVITLNVIGALLYTTVIAAFCDIATNSNPEETQFNQMLDDLNRFMTNNRLPVEMQTRLRAYLHQRKHIGRAESAQHVVHSLSSALQVEVTLLVHGDWLKHLWFLREAEHGCLVEVSARMEPRVYAPGELPERKHLYVIHHGIVLYAARVLTSGKMWGEDIILENEQDHLEHVSAATPPTRV